MSATRHLASHSLALLFFAVVAAAWSFPLVSNISTHLPGSKLGDNAQFFWNFWWMRTAMEHGAGFFRTPYLFAPAGVDLTLHSHTALPAFFAATVFGRWPVLTAMNLTTLVALAMNGFAAYLLAWRVGRHRGGAVLGGLVFGTSPYIAAHLNGHINLINVWVLPLFALALLDVIRGRRLAAIMAGILLAATLYIDYYYAVYEVVFAGTVVLLAVVECRRLERTRPRPFWLMSLLYGAILLDLGIVVVVWTTGGFSGRLGPVAISAREVFNPLQILWLLVALAIWLRWNRRLALVRAADAPPIRGLLGSLAAMAAAAALFAAPLLWHAAQFLVRGQYVSQHYYWRSAPVGIDLLTLIVGNPFNGLWGESVRRVYSGMGIDLIESGAWLGVLPLLLAALAWKTVPWAVVRTWTVVGGGFFAWALGSHVHAAGANLALLGPAVLVRFIPVMSNARMPGRALVMTYLAIAVLAAIAVANASWRRRWGIVGGAALLVVVDFMAAPFPMVPIDCPAIYQVVRDRPEAGALAELPLSVGDGLGELAPVDHAIFAYQATHGRPLVGGWVARLPPETLEAYRRDPLIAAWLRLSGMRGLETAALPGASEARAMMRADGIALVMLDRRRASSELRDYVERRSPLELIAEDGDRALYATRPAGEK